MAPKLTREEEEAVGKIRKRLWEQNVPVWRGPNRRQPRMELLDKRPRYVLFAIVVIGLAATIWRFCQ